MNTFSNPHAVTQIATGTASTTFSWDYRNRLTGTATSTVTGTTTDLYDHADQRVRKSNKNATTTYIGKFYDTTSTKGITAASTTAYIWVADTLVATVEGNGTATTTYFIHPDHLGSTNVITNASGTVKQVLDYKPFGEERINSNSNLARRTFIDQFYDREQSLSYLNARYLQNSRGQFLSQDPVFWEVGQTRDGKAALLNPQAQNSYSYAGNNPIVLKDPLGRYWELSVSGTISPEPGLPGFSGAIGLRFDSHGVVGFVAPGIGWGYGGKPLTISYTGGDIPRNRGTVSVIGTDIGPFGFSSDIQRNGGYGPVTSNFSIGLGLDVYIRKELSTPLLDRGSSPGLPLMSTSNFSTPNYYVATWHSVIQQSTSQARAGVVNSFNITSGATSNESRLWVTPNGAVITWTGQVVVPAPSAKK